MLTNITITVIKQRTIDLADAVGQIIFDFISVKELVDYIQESNLPEGVSIHDFNKTGESL